MTYKYCGTPDGPKSHIQDGEDCSYCKDWVKRGSPVITPESLAPKVSKAKPVKAKVKRAKAVTEREHGTMAGHRQHRTHGDPLCHPCREANNADKRIYRAKKREEQGLPPITIVRGERVHGSRRGAQQHRRNGETVCPECLAGERLAINAQRAAQRAKKKASE